MLVKKTEPNADESKSKEQAAGEFCDKPLLNQHLSPAYAETAMRWLRFGSKRNCATVREVRLKLMSKMNRLLLADECREIVQRLLEPAAKCFVFVKRNGGDPATDQFSLLCYANTADQDLCKRLDSDKCDYANSSFMIVGLPLMLWKEAFVLSGKSSSADVLSSVAELVKRTDELKQRYRPFVAGKRLTTIWGFIPRQRLLLLSIEGFDLQLCTYNWLTDFNTSLERMVKSSVHRYNSRTHLLQQICLKKMGLPRHAVGGHCWESCLDSVWQTPEMYSNPKGCIDERDLPSTSSSGSVSFENVFRDDSGSLWCELKSIESCGAADIAQAFIEQYICVRKMRLSEERTIDDVSLLANEWSENSKRTSRAFEETFLTNLCTRSHLLHMVFTPLMFEPHWRETLAVVRAPASSSNVPKSCALGVLRQMLKMRATDGATIFPKESLCDKRPGTHAWHANIQRDMFDQFTDYLHTLNLELVEIRLKDQETQEPLVDQSASPRSWFVRRCVDGLLLIHFFCEQPYLGGHFYILPDLLLNLPEYTKAERRLSEVCRGLIMDCHVHSFAYDFHLRLIASQIAQDRTDLFCPGYDLQSLLREFSLYYSCRPLFARSFLFQDELYSANLGQEADHLYAYLINNSEVYKLKAVQIQQKDGKQCFVGEAYKVLSYHSSLTVKVSERASGEAKYNAYHVILLRRGDRVSLRSCPDVVHGKGSLRFEIFSIYFEPSNIYPLDGKHIYSGRYERVQRSLTFTSAKDDAESIREYRSDSALDVWDAKPYAQLKYEEPRFSRLIKSQSLTNGSLFPTHERSTRFSRSRSTLKNMDYNNDGVERSDLVFFHFPLNSEQVNYVTFVPESCAEIESQLLTDRASFKGMLRRTVQEAASRCYWDGLWRKLLFETPVEYSGKKDHMSSISCEEFEALLCSTRIVDFVQLDQRVSFILQLSPSRVVSFMRCLQQTFADRSRYICSEGCKKQHLVIFCQKQHNCFIMVSVDFTDRASTISLCDREVSNASLMSDVRQTRLVDDGAVADKESARDRFCEEFVNAAAFHLWTQLCPTS